MSLLYCSSLTSYKRLKTREVKVGNILIGNNHPIRLQTMTTCDTMDTMGTVEEAIRCIDAGAELIRITAPSNKEAENLLNIKNELRKRGYETPLVADIHFTPNAADIAAKIVEKVRINPGNYVDKKKFQQLEYTDAEYAEEIERIRNRFIPLVQICKEHGTAMRIGTNHGSLSDRIMSRYGDTPMGMVESAMEFLRIARTEDYHQIILSMKASNTQVMVEAYRLLVATMQEEFGECYPLHLGVTEAGDGEDGRIKSAVGIGTLLEDGIGDTIRVSLTEDSEYEIPVCRDLVKRYPADGKEVSENTIAEITHLPYSPFEYKRRKTKEVQHIGGKKVPVVVADLSRLNAITPSDLKRIGYSYDEPTDKWSLSDQAADFAYLGGQTLDFALPGTLKLIVTPEIWANQEDKHVYFPIFEAEDYIAENGSDELNFLMFDCYSDKQKQYEQILDSIKDVENVVLCLCHSGKLKTQAIRRFFIYLEEKNIQLPCVIMVDSDWQTSDEHLIHFSTECGALLLDGFGDGIALSMTEKSHKNLANSIQNASGRNYNNNTSVEQFINTTAFGILQATRTRISKTEYISCPSCGRTLFDLQETTEKIRSVTHHLKGVKIAVMGCIVNGPGEMADADFGYVGSGVGKITLYKGKDVVRRNIPSEIAVNELINILKESNAWVEPA
ncbi:(E)-4-hydroxy-3-methylbut-2-enyl-diphosphate synthase [Rhizosphaericola mali]|uniref:4-hydroxy-3-methylbut-2-en-1-yl diphosphate synthase (flavodoxin) n=1 Tax=Rhizosphaericola mali TaxID=2545455 RepID=A0A5P2G1H9_9BACT|nr:(E)-4-hydroxy-3-methylbut-2-enyl-diphosphate synthase [Rhizosphaericola mali]QES87692.1 (E)-4-hydroxy-3-methylbut-2-enyl-diphosphate synthase [Rhizosphaericola mali]